MITKFEKRQRRQSSYKSRARSARFYAKLMMPVTMMVFASALWSDPVLGPRLAQGVEEIKPTLANYLADTPLEDLFETNSEVTDKDALTDTTDEA